MPYVNDLDIILKIPNTNHCTTIQGMLWTLTEWLSYSWNGMATHGTARPLIAWQLHTSSILIQFNNKFTHYLLYIQYILYLYFI